MLQKVRKLAEPRGQPRAFGIYGTNVLYKKMMVICNRHDMGLGIVRQAKGNIEISRQCGKDG